MSQTGSLFTRLNADNQPEMFWRYGKLKIKATRIKGTKNNARLRQRSPAGFLIGKINKHKM